jgi:hypothetical protein
MNTNNPGVPAGDGSQEREAEAAAAAAAVAASGAHASEAASSTPPEEESEGQAGAGGAHPEAAPSGAGAARPGAETAGAGGAHPEAARPEAEAARPEAEAARPEAEAAAAKAVRPKAAETAPSGAGATRPEALRPEAEAAEAAASGAGAAQPEAEAAAAEAVRPKVEAESRPDEPAGESAEPDRFHDHDDVHNHLLHHNHRYKRDLNPTLEEQAEPSPLASLNHVISANFRRAVLALVMACAGLGLTYASGGVLPAVGTERPVQFFQAHQGLAQTLAILGAVMFFVFGISAVRSATKEILKTVPHTIDDNRKNGLRWVCLLVGYLVIIFGTLGALNVPIERLLVGGAVTGVILGIAAQQALGNIFAGLLLLITRPFAIGDEVSLRSGPMGGVLTGLVADMNLNYVKIVTDRGTVLLPNSSILTASVGPAGVFDR